jgi:hypothetical protein
VGAFFLKFFQTYKCRDISDLTKKLENFEKIIEKKFEKNLEGKEKCSIFAVPFGKEVT